MNTDAGFQLDQKHIIQAEIGRGGMGIVYRGYDTRLQRPVAIKVLAPHLSQDPEAVARFRQEAVAAANLQHPNIVTIHNVGEENGYYFIIMELLEGVSLDKWLAEHAPLPLPQASQLLKQLAAALDYAHQHHIVHRDVKPANVTLAANGHATLMDFGLVRAANPGDGSSGGGGGTPSYMAPEQIMGGAVDARADIYALGVVAYEMVTGQRPFVRDTPLATAYAHVADAPRPPRELRADLPAPAEAVILKALAKKPDDRFAHASELAAAFALACKGRWPAGLKPTPTPLPLRQSTPVPTPRAGRAGFPLPWLALILGLLIVVSGGLAWTLTRPPQMTPAPTQATADAGSSAGEDTPTPVAHSVKTAPPAVVSPAASPTTSPQPTNTLAPTFTPTPRPTTRPPSPTPTVTTVVAAAAPVLLEPPEGQEVTGATTFVWAWTGYLATDQAFEVHVWQEGAGEHRTAAGAEAQSAGAGRWQQRIDISQTAAVRAGGPGAYWWTVVLVRTAPYQVLGAEATPRRLTVK